MLFDLDTDLSFDFCQTPSAAHFLRFFGSDTPSADDSREVTGELSLNRTTSLSPSQRLLLSLDGKEPAEERTSQSEQRDVEQGRNGSVSEGNQEMMFLVCVEYVSSSFA